MAHLGARHAGQPHLLVHPGDLHAEVGSRRLDVHERLHFSSPPWDSTSRRSTLPLVVPRIRHGITKGEDRWGGSPRGVQKPAGPHFFWLLFSGGSADSGPRGRRDRRGDGWPRGSSSGIWGFNMPPLRRWGATARGTEGRRCRADGISPAERDSRRNLRVGT